MRKFEFSKLFGNPLIFAWPTTRRKDSRKLSKISTSAIMGSILRGFPYAASKLRGQQMCGIRRMPEFSHSTQRERMRGNTVVAVVVRGQQDAKKPGPCDPGFPV